MTKTADEMERDIPKMQWFDFDRVQTNQFITSRQQIVKGFLALVEGVTAIVTLGRVLYAGQYHYAMRSIMKSGVKRKRELEPTDAD